MIILKYQVLLITNRHQIVLRLSRKRRVVIVQRQRIQGERLEVVKNEGFVPKGSGQDLLAHTTSNITAGDFVLTSSEQGIADALLHRRKIKW